MYSIPSIFYITALAQVSKKCDLEVCDHVTLYFQNLLYPQKKVRACLSDQTTDNTLEAPGYKLVQTILLKVTNESIVVEIMGKKNT